MGEIEVKDKVRLADLIRKNINESFETFYITRNLVNTIKIKYDENFNFTISIPAQMYDFEQWNKKKVVVYTGKGSYAQLVDKKGGFSKKHKNFVEKAIKKAIRQWMKEMKVKGEVTYE